MELTKTRTLLDKISEKDNFNDYLYNDLIEYMDDLEDDYINWLNYYNDEKKDNDTYSFIECLEAYLKDKEVSKADFNKLKNVFMKEIKEFYTINTPEKIKYLLDNVEENNICSVKDFNGDWSGGSYKEEWDNTIENFDPKNNLNNLSIGIMDNNVEESYYDYDDDIIIKKDDNFYEQLTIGFKWENNKFYGYATKMLIVTDADYDNEKIYKLNSFEGIEINGLNDYGKWLYRVGEL